MSLLNWNYKFFVCTSLISELGKELFENRIEKDEIELTYAEMSGYSLVHVRDNRITGLVNGSTSTVTHSTSTKALTKFNE